MVLIYLSIFSGVSAGVIDIRILDELDSIQVEIEDNGKGIAQKGLLILQFFILADHKVHTGSLSLPAGGL